MKLIDLDGNTWDGTKLSSKYKPVYNARGTGEMMGVTLGWLYDAPEFDLEKHDAEIRNKAIEEFAERLKDSLVHKYRHLLEIDTDGFEWLTTDAVGTHIDEIAESMKGEKEC
jgi:hypothetical protein